MSAPDATPARGDVYDTSNVVSGVFDRPSWMTETEWLTRCWADAMKGDIDRPMGDWLVRVFALLDEARAERDALAQRVAALEAFVRKAEKDWSCDEDDHWMADACDKCRALDALRATPTPEGDMNRWQRMYWANAVLCVLLVIITTGRGMSFWISFVDALIAAYSVFKALSTEAPDA